MSYLFAVEGCSPEEVEQAKREIDFILSQREADPNNPPFLLVRTKSERRGREPSVVKQFAVNMLDKDHVEAIFDLILHPERAWEKFKKHEINSDEADNLFIARKGDNVHPSQRTGRKLFHITHIAVVNHRGDSIRDAQIKAIFDLLLKLLPEGKKRVVHRGAFMTYRLINDQELSEQPEEDQRAIRGHIESLKELNATTKLYDCFQIPWFLTQEEAHAEFDESGRDGMTGSKSAIPCAIYALMQAGVKQETIDKVYARLKYSNGAAKTNEISKIIKQDGYGLLVPKISVQKGYEKLSYNFIPRKVAGEERTYFRMDCFEGHWFYDREVEYKKITIWMSRLLRMLKKAGAIVPMNGYEYLEKWHNVSFDERIEFDALRWVKERKGELQEGIDYDTPVYRDRKKAPAIVGFADFEASTDEEYHIPYSCSLSFLDEDDKYYSYFGLNSPLCFLQTIHRKVNPTEKWPKTKDPQVRIYFYNLKYDWNFFRKFLRNVQTVESGGKLYSFTGQYSFNHKKINIEFWDLLTITMTKLSNAGKAYLTPEQQQTIKKEAYPYTYYSANVIRQGASLCECDRFVDAYVYEKAKYGNYEYEENRAVIRKALEDAKAIVETAWGERFVDVKKYCIFYNEQDVRITKEVYRNLCNLFKGDHLEGIVGENPLHIDMEQFRTASSMGYDYFWRTCLVKYDSANKVWEPRFELALPKRALRAVIQKSIRGGRVMTRDNKMITYKKEDYGGALMQDYDGVSLYPSAMSKLWITDGKPELIKGNWTDVEFEQWCTHPDAPIDGSQRKLYNDMIVHVTMIHTNTPRHFPLLCIKNPETGLNEYKNFDADIVDTWVNSIDLFNLIELQGAMFEWDAAVAWPGERHYEVRSMITNLFDFRVNNKKHPVQAVTKLIMNSIYGKSTMKASKSTRQYIDKTRWQYDEKTKKYNPVDNWEAYFRANAYKIKSFEPLGVYGDLTEEMAMESCEQILVKEFCRDESSNFNIFGSNVLAMARRIIGQVMALAEDLEGTFEDQKPRLFYTDTDSMHITEDLLAKLVPAYQAKYGRELQGTKLCQFHIDFDPIQGKAVKGATESIFLAKKMYADHLIAEDDKTEGYHFRMKGIPNAALSWDKYKNLSMGDIVEFEITDYQVSFFYDGGKVGSRPTMKRKIGVAEAQKRRREEMELLEKVARNLERLDNMLIETETQVGQEEEDPVFATQTEDELEFNKKESEMPEVSTETETETETETLDDTVLYSSDLEITIDEEDEEKEVDILENEEQSNKKLRLQ